MNLEVPAISKHLKNIFETNETKQNSVVSKMETTAAVGKNYQTNELKEVATISILETVQKGGNRNVKRNFINEIKIDCEKANKWFVEVYKNEIKDLHFSKWYFNGSKEAGYADVFYILYDGLIVDFDSNNSVTRFLFRKSKIKKVEAVINGIKKFRKRKAAHKPEISLLVNTLLKNLFKFWF